MSQVRIVNVPTTVRWVQTDADGQSAPLQVEGNHLVANLIVDDRTVVISRRP